MKATRLLEQQHRKVEAIFDQLKGRGDQAGALLVELANELAAHMAIEQNIFYPAVREVDPDLIAESFEEHAVAEIELKRLLRAGPDHETFPAKLATLQELIESHVEEEEEELFRSVEKTLGGDFLEQLGAKMESAFVSAKEEGFERLLPEGFGHTSSDESLKALAAQRPLPSQESPGVSR